jgi:hypothetical protein
VHSPTEVAHLQRVPHTDQNVLGLDVAVDDVLRMAVLDRLDHLLKIPRRPSLRERTAALQQRIKLAAWSHLKHEVDAPLVVEEAVHAQDVHMSAVRLDFDLAAQLVLYPMLDQLSFVQYLQRENEARSTVTRDVDRAEFPSTKTFPDVDIP